MKTRAAFVLTAAIALAIPITCPAQLTTAERPPIKVGQVSVYLIQEMASKNQWEDVQIVTAVDGDMVRVSSTNATREPRERELLFTTEWNTITSAVSGSRSTPHTCQLNFPLALGKTWPSKFEIFVPSNGAKLRADWSSKVVGIEQVQVPAGTFDAFKIEQTGWNNGVSFSGVIKVWQAVWYAPSAGRIVRSEYKDWAGSNLPRVHNVLELKSLRDPT